MNKLILLAVAAVALVGVTAWLMMEKPTMTAYPPEVVQKFKNFCVKYNKYQTGTDPDVVVFRLGVYYSNYKKIEAHNAIDKEEIWGENSLMDLTHEEFVKYYLGLRLPANFQEPMLEVEGSYADLDWRTKGRVTPVKNQGQCGSCWAFSTTGGIEGLEFATSGYSLSEQQLVDCSGSFGNQGCNGGLMDDAFKYVIQNGITTETKYPYEAVDQNCAYTSADKVYTISGYTDVESGNCDDLYAKLQVQPVSIAVDAETWQFYVGGIKKKLGCGTSLDHGVLLVGYTNSAGTSGDKPAWIVKNSWGDDWGISGYITLQGEVNTCGLANSASVPTA